jgi:hypothetical protein
MKIEEFCDKHQILYQIVLLEIKDGKKHFKESYHMDILGYIPRYIDFEKEDKIRDRMERYQKNKKYILEACDKKKLIVSYALDTRQYQIIDIDDKRIMELDVVQGYIDNKYPRYLSITKNFAKVFCKIKMPPHSQTKMNEAIYVKDSKKLVELHNGIWSYIHHQQDIIDGESPIPEIELQSFKDEIQKVLGKSEHNITYPKTTLPSIMKVKEGLILEAPPKNEFENLLMMLNPKTRLTDRHNWLAIGFLIKTYFPNDKGFEMWGKVSMLVKKFKDDNWTLEGDNYKTWASLKPDGRITYESLKRMIQYDNEEGYFRIFPSKIASYNETKEEFEKYNFKVMIPFMYVSLNDINVYETRNKDQMQNAYINKIYEYIKVDEKTGKKTKQEGTFIKRWILDPQIKTYESIVFKPNQPKEFMMNGKLYYNMFDGLFVEKIEDVELTLEDEERVNTGLELFMELIWNICGKHEASFYYFLNWVSHIFQKPHKKTKVAPVFKSIEGIGKNSVIEYLGMLIGYFLISSNPNDLFGQFNPLVKCKLLMAYNEASGKTNMNCDESIKTMITDDTIRHEEKYKSAYTIDNNVNVVIMTNHLSPIRISPTDRRFVCFEGYYKVLPPSVFDELYFLFDVQTNIGKRFAKKIGNFFLTRDITQFKPTQHRPKTNLYKSMKSVPIILSFLKEYFETHGELLDNSTTIYNDLFSTYMKNSNFDIMNKDRFFKALREFIKEEGYENGFITKIISRHGTLYQVKPQDFYNYMIEQEFMTLEDIPLEPLLTPIENDTYDL